MTSLRVPFYLILLKFLQGFAMLARMGYTPGTSLGKDGTGRKDPVPIQIKGNTKVITEVCLKNT